MFGLNESIKQPCLREMENGKARVCARMDLGSENVGTGIRVASAHLSPLLTHIYRCIVCAYKMESQEDRIAGHSFLHLVSEILSTIQVLKLLNFLQISLGFSFLASKMMRWTEVICDFPTPPPVFPTLHTNYESEPPAEQKLNTSSSAALPTHHIHRSCPENSRC